MHPSWYTRARSVAAAVMARCSGERDSDSARRSATCAAAMDNPVMTAPSPIVRHAWPNDCIEPLGNRAGVFDESIREIGEHQRQEREADTIGDACVADQSRPQHERRPVPQIPTIGSPADPSDRRDAQQAGRGGERWRRISRAGGQKQRRADHRHERRDAREFGGGRVGHGGDRHEREPDPNG